ncbi:indole-3-glycerol phosphate synthase TrpC [Gottschalkia acidurici 9a]|uniref:Indole-3-glycerol phosphate synthase n=1 Tax=Gottschalkia acidurici (strain ATCC 7906 / DSM 604 / BCRC 14475 / CIP 104303 / KCTC 5404 / NCIMB 10678 / 9a) TaxID=1128398 RepID=K0AZE7_GOTA9|nr:indole-3-glycerol phosphate synthase TrpC [Gottschalkia acidurici]AFS77746.1 indole-3-glycerol phosphate synthase TrpC [Gottschalkia acidurici 9a]
MFILDKIVEVKKKQLEIEKQEISLEEMIEKSKEDRIIRDFEDALDNDDISVISEIKKASPSRGIIKEDFNPVFTAKIYEESPFNAISVLTEREFFLGDDKYINMVKEVTTKPILRKDFIIDEYQIYQSKVIGADAILLIAAILKGKLKSYYDLAKSLGLHVLVEVHGEDEIEEAIESGCRLIGINNRNLKTFDVDLKHTEKLIKLLPSDKIVISESGIKGYEDMEYLKYLGVKGVLVGETLMRNLSNEPKSIILGDILTP